MTIKKIENPEDRYRLYRIVGELRGLGLCQVDRVIPIVNFAWGRI